MSKDLGKSTSYAYYVAEGGTKTPQEYGEMLVNIDTVATRAEDAADSAAESATGALNSKNAAQTAATTATTKASEATTAASTATTKAGEASTSASTATSAKDTAVSASQTATSKATEATTAAATATSAKTDAVAANTAAQSAKTAAQTAQAGAETAAASVQSSAAQIATNAADISDIKEEISYINGDIVDAINFKLLNGFDKNNSQAGTYNASGGIDASSSYTASLTYARVKPNTNYQAFYSATGKKEYTSVAWYDAAFRFIRKDSGMDLLATSPSNAAYCRMSVPTANIATTVFVEGAVFNGYADFGYELILDEDVTIPSLDAVERELTPFSYETTSQAGYLTSSGTYDGTPSYHSISTNKIECQEDDVFTYTGIGKWSAQSYLVYDSSNTIIDYAKIDGTDDVTIPENGVAVIFSSFAANGTDVTLSVSKKNPLNIADQVAKNTADINALLVNNPLQGKKISVTGDSICYGEGYTGGYAKIIGENNNMTVQNIAVSGGTIVNRSGAFCISESIENMDSDADYAIVEGGFNDAASASAPPLGGIAVGYNAVYDTTTFYGAFETMLRDLLIRFQGKKIGYIAVHQATNNYRVGNDPDTSYYWAARKCCEKWGVPFCDLNVQVPAFGYFTATNADMLAIKNAYTLNGDGTHPNELCYRKYYAPKIEAWLKTL